MTPDDTLLSSDQWLARPSSEQFPPAAGESKYRDPQPDITESERLGALSPNEMTLSSSPSGLRALCRVKN